MTEDEMVGWLDSMDMSLSKLQEMVKDREAWWACCSPWGWQRVGHDRANEHNISQFLEYTHDHCTFLNSGLSGM